MQWSLVYHLADAATGAARAKNRSNGIKPKMFMQKERARTVTPSNELVDCTRSTGGGTEESAAWLMADGGTEGGGDGGDDGTATAAMVVAVVAAVVAEGTAAEAAPWAAEERARAVEAVSTAGEGEGEVISRGGREAAGET